MIIHNTQLADQVQAYSVSDPDEHVRQPMSLFIKVCRKNSKGEDEWFHNPSQAMWKTQQVEHKYGEQLYFCTSLPGDCGTPVLTPQLSVVGMHVAGTPDGGGNYFLHFSTFFLGALITATNSRM